jgi:hypothetical protein
MNLDEQLRAALNLEAEMRTAPPPDVEGMISGGQARRRRRNAAAAAGGLLALVLVGAGIYGATQLGDDPKSEPPVVNEPSEPAEAAIPPAWPDNEEAVPPGTYRVLVGYDADGGAIEADVTIDGSNWEGSNYPVAGTPQGFAGFGVYRPEAVAGGCRMEAGLESAATDPRQLVQQLVGMPRSEVVEAPARTNDFGGSATHLQLRIDAFCGGGAFYQVAEAPPGSRGISYFDGIPEGDSGDVIVDFWVLDVDGTAVIIDRFHTADAPDDLVAQATSAADSISFVTAE